MTKQQILSQTYKYFILDKNPSGWDFEVGHCKYQTHDGNHCAFGIFIPKHLYEKSWEGNSSTGILRESSSLRKYLGNPGPKIMDFFELLQTYHDTSATELIDSLKSELKFSNIPYDANWEPESTDFHTLFGWALEQVAHHYKLKIPSVRI